ncbi:MAG: hypothetical protein A2046_09875 [Bacteroidetes bacterium GWA2_30_7]|nr:MAG: hypothetical protein A2046_09875 [Bacteroidetes bacterium GWA2_30_7]
MKQIFFLTTLFFISLFAVKITFGQTVLKCNEKLFEDKLIDKIIGSWTASGKIGGDNVVYNISVSWELNHQFAVLTLADTALQPQYTAKVFIGYDCLSERYVMHWLDNFGGRFSETLGYGLKSEQSIEFRFEYPEGPFINKFIYDNKTDTWQFHSTTKNNKGVWDTFGDIFLKRKQ